MEENTNKKSWTGKIIVIVLIVAAIGAYYFIPSVNRTMNNIVKMFASGDFTVVREFVASYGVYAVLVSFALMILQSIAAPLPAFLITFANASLFGWWKGAILSWSSAMAGAAVCFFIARILGRDVVEKLTSKAGLEQIDEFFDKHGQLSILIARLLPFISFDIVSYAAGLTSMSFGSFFLATGIGQLPATIVYSYVGGMLTGGAKMLVSALFILFALAALIVLLKQVYSERQKKKRNNTYGEKIRMKRRIISVVLAALMTLSLAACGSKSEDASGNDDSNSEKSIEEMSFDELKEAAKGSTVTFYGWGGDEKLNEWLDDVFAPQMKEKYDITMERVPMDIDQILSQLSGEIQAGEEDGSIDMIWINGENFQSAKENNMLYGPFTDRLPNFNDYIDTESEDVTLDFAYPIEGYEAPYGKAQMVLVGDTAVTSEFPKSAEELLEFVKKYPGKVTYPALPDFTGSVFVRSIIYEICGYEQFLNMEADKETVKEAVEPAMEYLRQLNPYLWNEGKTFPDSSTTLDNMFADGEVILNVTYDAFATAVKIEEGTYTETTQTFQFDKGTIGNTNFMAIAANSQNKAGAMVAINEMMSPEIQADRYNTLKVLPVVDYDKLSDEQKEEFDKVDLGKGTIPQDELLAKRLPEMPAELVPIIEEIWEEEVVGK